MAVLIAGRDTTAATLSWTIYELANYPDIFQKLRNEVLAIVGTSKTPTYEDLKNMSYLTHTLNETLRLYPAVPYNLRAALQDTTLPGEPGQPDIAVLQGDVVVYSALSMASVERIYIQSRQRSSQILPYLALIAGTTGRRKHGIMYHSTAAHGSAWVRTLAVTEMAFTS